MQITVYPAPHICSLHCREVLPQAGIVDLASFFVHLDKVIFQLCTTSTKHGLYILNDTNDISPMEDCDWHIVNIKYMNIKERDRPMVSVCIVMRPNNGSDTVYKAYG